MRHLVLILALMLMALPRATVAAAGEVPPKTDAIPTLALGAPAPTFKLPGVDGKEWSLESFAAARLLAVVFTCNHCPTAQAYEVRIKKLVEDYRAKGVAVVAISPNDPKAVRLDELGYSDLSDSLEEMQLRARDAKFNFPYLYDGETQAVTKRYGPKVTPHVFIFDAERKLRYVGGIDNDEKEARVKTSYVRDALDALLAGTPVPLTKSRVFGCSIKWADKRSGVEQLAKQLAAEKVSLAKLDATAAAELRANKGERLRLINVWATWCGPCVSEFPDLVTVHRMYRGRPFEFVTVSIDRPNRFDEALAILAKHQASNANYLFAGDDRNALAEALDKEWSGAVPLTLLVKPGGEIIYRREGKVDPLELKRAIVGVLGRTY